MANLLQVGGVLAVPSGSIDGASGFSESTTVTLEPDSKVRFWPKAALCSGSSLKGARYAVPEQAMVFHA
ncbi:hypothetical protein [Variovorax sp. ZT4R33]|uniref:hypothetical protein n=1 Tax=Variovorax sp. ZT4R33 TaxID=3443743 RepID=UPI003F47B815